MTVVMPARNAEKTIAAAMQSVLAQTYREFELWVLENGSIDTTAQVARSIRDARVRVFELGAVGFQGALGWALKNVPSVWIARMDADDISLPRRLERQMEILQTNPACILIGTAYAYITPSGHVVERVLTAPSREVTRDRMGHLRMGFRKEHKGRFFNDATVVFRRSVASEVGGYDPEFSIGDLPMWIRMLERGRGYEIAEVHYLCRLSPTSMSRQDTAQQQTLAIRAKYFGGIGRVGAVTAERVESLWSRLYVLDMMCGDLRSARADLRNLERESTIGRRMAIRRALLNIGRLGVALMRYRMRNTYRYSHERDVHCKGLIRTYENGRVWPQAS